MITITSTFSENDGKHSISETFKCGDIAEAKNVLRDILDLTVGKDHMPVKPDHTVIRKNLKKYAAADDEFIENELKRLDNAWNLYCCVMNYVNMSIIGGTPPVSLEVDANTCLTVVVKD